MSRLNLETLRNLSLLDPAMNASATESVSESDSNESFVALLDRARSALDHPRSASYGGDDSRSERTASERGRASANHDEMRSERSRTSETSSSRGASRREKASDASESDDTTTTQTNESDDTTTEESSQVTASDSTETSASEAAGQETSKTTEEDGEALADGPSTAEEAQVAALAMADVMAIPVQPIPVANAPVTEDAPTMDIAAEEGVATTPSPLPQLPPGMTGVPPLPPSDAAKASTGEAEPGTEGQTTTAATTGETEQAAVQATEASEALVAKVQQAQQAKPQEDGESTGEGEDASSATQRKGSGKRAKNNQAAVTTTVLPLAETTATTDGVQAQATNATADAAAAAVVVEAATTTSVPNGETTKNTGGDTAQAGVESVQSSSSGEKATSQTSSSNADKQATSDVNPIDRVRFVQRVARAFESVGNSGGSIRLKLYPPELGALRMEVTVRNGVMTARVEAETPAAQSMLVENLPTLKERLAEQNIRVERFDVDLMNSGQGGNTDQSNAQAQQQELASRVPSYRGQTPSTSEATATPQRPVAKGSNSRFDVTI